MQKQKKQMIVIIIILILFVAAYFGMRSYNAKQEEKEAAETEAEKIYVTELKKDDITAFSYQTDGETLSFVKEEDTWKCENDETLTLDETAISTMLSTVATLEAAESVEDAGELSEYGFDTPTNVITLTTEKGTTTLTIGMNNSITDQYYMTKDGDDSLYLVSSGVPAAFEKTLADLEAEEETEQAISETETE